MSELSSMAKYCLEREKELLGDNPSEELTHIFRQGFIAALEADKIMYDMIMKMKLLDPISKLES
jgi:hypothetical protein